MKNLPIKLFKKRDDIDDRRTEGGGSGDLPKWILSRQELFEMSTQFLTVIEKSKEILINRVESDNFLPAILKISLKDKAVAKTHRAEVGKIFNVSHKFNFLGMSDECDLLIKVDDLKDAVLISQNISAIDKNAHGLSAIENMELFSPFIEVDSNVLKIRLINYNNYNINNIVEGMFIKSLNEHKIAYKKTKYAADLTIFKIENATIDVLEDIKGFEAMYSITSMPKLGVGLDSVDEEFTIDIKYPKDGVEYPIVGVLDSGIQSIPQLSPWLIADSYSCYPETLLDRSHGTFVAGIIVYGDQLQGKNWVGNEGCRLYSAAVFPDLKLESVDEDQLIENIREAINKRPDIKIWNFSGGMQDECDLNDFSDFGKFLDDIQQTNDIVICKSAGNCQNFKIPKATQRIPKSADSVRSLVVGSIAHEKGIYDLAETNWPSPFSRTGFGPNNLVKPDVIHYGGNAGILPSGLMASSGVKSFSTGGRTVSNIGTSFSTPRITSLVAALDHKIDEDFNSLLLKALIIHSAKYPNGVDLPPLEKIKHMGYGLPSDVEEILYNSPNEITLILQDTISKGSFYEILDFPYPSEMIEDGKFYGEITITLVTAPLLDNNNATEYCQSNIDISFGTYDRVKERDTNTRTILNEYGPDGAINLLHEARYSKKHLNNPLSEFAHERLLRNYGKKFHPVKKYAINLNELTQTNAMNALTAPKKWFLRLEGLFSAYAEARAVIDGTELSQEFCAIISIKDKRNNKDVYDSVSRHLDSNNFISQNIQLRNELNIRYGSSGN
ncbi:S8 family peptidase [Pedobacter punctiformis]|uniref:S8 family peptidase n=1 Tax=Pedobacter punctiformis TaxID=3004097 RepID=A0ABT4LBS5_9SPHI|nr:S8 family peptidase [Pedobacter sp. HCMS5-2]MCZ4244259.1 S8 family peptidase [Pedobacter sp. HCMS5-2]